MPQKRALRTSTFHGNATLLWDDPDALLQLLCELIVLAMVDLLAVGMTFE